MKPLAAWILISSLVLPAWADEAADKTPPPAAEKNVPKPPDAPAFLGVGTTVIPDLLLEHLHLEPGVGIMIESLHDDGPAAKAGIKEGDIITRISGNPVKSALDLGEKIRAHKPGDAVKIDVIQKGKPGTLDITLVERPADLIDPAMLQLMGGPGADNLQNRVNDLQQRVRALQLQMGGAAPGLMLNGGINVNGGGEFRMGDNEGTVGYKADGDGTQVTVRDHNDKIVWSGPWDTDQDKAAAPEDIRARIERFNIRKNALGNGFQLRMGGEGFAPPQNAADPEAGEDEEEEP